MAQDEVARITALVAALEADRGYGTGRRTFPRTLDPADATLIAERLSDAVDQGVDTRARKAAADGMHIACAPGCSACCNQLVMVWLPEAMRVAEHLARPENTPARTAFLAAYPAWRERMGDAPERVAELTAKGEVQAQGRALLAAWRERVMCAFNHEGMCAIYAVRPNICRAHHALETAENCHPDPTVTPAHVAFVPLDTFLRRAASLNAAMHHALGGKRERTVALCQAVYEMLTTAPR